MMSKNSIDKNEISSKILQYGSDILNSDAFRKCAYQRHHLHGTVFEHTINVYSSMNKYRDFDNYLKEYPSQQGYFGKYGGNYLDDPELIKAFFEYAEAYNTIAQSGLPIFSWFLLRL